MLTVEVGRSHPTHQSQQESFNKRGLSDNRGVGSRFGPAFFWMYGVVAYC